MEVIVLLVGFTIFLIVIMLSIIKSENDFLEVISTKKCIRCNNDTFYYNETYTYNHSSAHLKCTICSRIFSTDTTEHDVYNLVHSKLKIKDRYEY